MFHHMFDPASIAGFRLLLVLAQAGPAALILAPFAAVGRAVR
jgi:hypothetical protein